MRRARDRTRREPTIALINIVFLMLVFFMVAGTLAQPLERDVTLVRTRDLEGRAPPDALVVAADATLSYRGTRLVPDRALPAQALVRIARDLRSKGAERVLIVTERGLE